MALRRHEVLKIPGNELSASGYSTLAGSAAGLLSARPHLSLHIVSQSHHVAGIIWGVIEGLRHGSSGRVCPLLATDHPNRFQKATLLR